MKRTTKSRKDVATGDWVDDRIRRARQLVAASLLALAGGVIPTEAGASASYLYDSLGRVVVARYDNGVCIAYVYDANGNRTSQVNGSTSGPSAALWGTGTYGCFVWSP